METAGVKYVLFREESVTDDHQADIRGFPSSKGLMGYRIPICSSGADSFYYRGLGRSHSYRAQKMRILPSLLCSRSVFLWRLS